MTLIIILLGLTVEHFVGVNDTFRRTEWFIQYQQWLENRLAHYPFWTGPVGLILTLSLPLCLLLIIDLFLLKFFWPLQLLFAFIILIYALGPKYLNPELDNYIDCIESGDDEHAREIVMDIVGTTNAEGLDQQTFIENIFLQSNTRLFAVLFWFLILGPFGALLYRLATESKSRYFDIHGGYADATRDLYNILNWPTARLFAIGNALAGNLVDAVEAWRENETGSLDNNEIIIKTTGLGALQYLPVRDTDEENLPDNSYWIRATQGLLNRTLLIWLTVLGLMTLSGHLG